MNTPDKKSGKLQKPRQRREKLEVSYEMSDVCPKKRDRMVKAKRGPLNDAKVTSFVGFSDPVLFFDN